jgi:hypothetical protein
MPITFGEGSGQPVVAPARARRLRATTPMALSTAAIRASLQRKAPEEPARAGW